MIGTEIDVTPQRSNAAAPFNSWPATGKKKARQQANESNRTFSSAIVVTVDVVNVQRKLKNDVMHAVLQSAANSAEFLRFDGFLLVGQIHFVDNDFPVSLECA